MIVRDYNLTAIFLFSLSHVTKYTKMLSDLIALLLFKVCFCGKKLLNNGSLKKGK